MSTEEKDIEDILWESHSVNMLKEVRDRAGEIMGSEDYDGRRVDAYQTAYHELVGSKL
tara:strand:- start:278 stop:451 length:174 start_codon:yes stop_codon:yes gene_type:complete